MLSDLKKDLMVSLPVRLTFGDHIPYDNGKFSGSGGDGSTPAFPVSDPFEERSKRVLFLISDAIGCLAEGNG